MRKIIFILYSIIFSAYLMSEEIFDSLNFNNDNILHPYNSFQRPYLNYKTLSDLDENKPDYFTIYGPELFSSYNSTVPYGQNDGALWQGKGINNKLSIGAFFKYNGLSITFKPELVYSQNLPFDYVTPNSAYSIDLYRDKAGVYGYYGIPYIDAPQRFGNSYLLNFSWGDSDIRFTWKTFTIGFGTQLIWLGPAEINPIIHSNNAPPYPKFDIGLKKTPITIFSWYAGDFETRLWIGYLSESSFFDKDNSNDHNMISGLSLCFSPSLTKGLSLFINRTYLSPFSFDSFYTIPKLFIINLKHGGAQDTWDQRASIGFNYFLIDSQTNIYSEIGLNDYGPSLDGYIRYPFHSMVYTLGIKKISYINENISNRILFEISSFEMSQDFQFQWPSTFYAHHQITQGYTNQGQWIGAGNGTGGNSQYLSFDFFSKNWNLNIFFHRSNPDNDYIYSKSIQTIFNDDIGVRPINDFRADLNFGLIYSFFYEKALISTGINISQINNRLYKSVSWSTTNKDYNFNFIISLKYFL